MVSLRVRTLNVGSMTVRVREVTDLMSRRKILCAQETRWKATKDFTHIKQVKNSEGIVLKREDEIKGRWKVYFETLLNEENPRMPTEYSEPNQGIVRDIEREEIIRALRTMKNGKATGPDEIPVEAWKSLGADGVDLLWSIMRKVFREERIPEDWRDSTNLQRKG
ncbi:hypothetical protein M8J77_013428 [Diaphorina citri]|nr:hypothetical protein M8J77_013428 [Diaphorina citri]